MWLLWSAVVGCREEPAPSITEPPSAAAPSPERPSFVFDGAPLVPQNALARNSVGHGLQTSAERTAAQAGPYGVEGELPEGPLGLVDPIGCDASAFAVLSPADLVIQLRETTVDCLYFLWTFDPEVATVLSDANLAAVAQAVEADAPAFDGTNDLGLVSLVYTLRVAYYHEFYEPTFAIGVDADVEDAVTALGQNPHLLDLTDLAGALAYHFTVLVDTAGLGDGHVPFLGDAVSAFLADPARQSDPYQGLVVYAVCYLVSRTASFDPAFDAALDADLVSALGDLANAAALVPSQTWLVDNAIWALGHVFGVPAHEADAVAHVTDVLTTFAALSEPYLWAVNVLDTFHACQTSVPGQTICKSDIAPGLEATLFPSTFAFDDGAIVVRTAEPLADIQLLYHAIKQVQAQFNRVTETIVPLAGDPNPALTVVIYASRADYELYQPFLFGFGTANGGIYIEQDGTFFSYQRTPADSIYSLEELFRHEYVHYLVGRFLIDGMWGSEPIYQGDRMVWFDEGLAEFFDWSTRADGVQVRKRLVDLVAADATRMTVAEIVSATYGDFRFYRYAGLFFSYLYEEDLGTLQELVRAAHAGDVVAFDALVDGLATDGAVQAGYDAFLDDQIAASPTLTDPATVVPDLAALAEGDVAALEAVFQATRLGALGQCDVAAAALEPRFTCRGVLSSALAPAPLDAVEVWGAFDAGLDEILGELDGTGIDNFQTADCRFGAIRPADAGGGQAYGLADYYCEGSLPPGAYLSPDPFAALQADLASTRFGAGAVCVDDGVTAECAFQVVTIERADGTPEDVFTDELDGALAEVHNQIYAASPSRYASLGCVRAGAPTVAVATAGTSYRIDAAACSMPSP